MTSTSNPDLLKLIPDFTSWHEATEWLQESMQPCDLGSDAEFTTLEWSDIQEKRAPHFGLYASENWRKFVLATYLADLISYPEPDDQVNFDRLLFVMHAFPQGFRTWWMRHPNEPWRLAGYTAWYPMFEAVYDIFENSPEKLRDRLVAPNTYSSNPNASNQRPLLYLFNYSVRPELRKSALAKTLMTCYAEDISLQNPRGLACITVSDDGKRIAKRFGMSCSGHLNYDGCGVYVTARPSQKPERQKAL